MNIIIETENVEIDPDVFDYRIKIDYDGKEVLQIKLLRNEVDLTRRKIAVEKYGQSITKNIDEFWKRDKVQVKDYKKEDYNKRNIKKFEYS